MNLHDISKKLDTKALNENLSQLFQTKIDVETFTLEQLEDARNRIRTSLSQFETNESFDKVFSNENYQKNRLFLDVLNSAISEKNFVTEKTAKKDYDKDGKVETPSQEYKGSKDKAIKKAMGKKVDEANKKPDADGDGVPDWADKKDGPDPAPKRKGTKNMPPQLRKHAEKKMNEKAVSQAQQKFMGMVHAAQKGEKPASAEVADVAKNMKKKDAKDFASTKHKGLPKKVASESHEEFDEAWFDSVKKYLKKKKYPVRTKTSAQDLFANLGKMKFDFDLPDFLKGKKKTYSHKRRPGVMDYLRKKHGEYDLASIERNGVPMNEQELKLIKQLILEGEEDKAELVMAAKDMVDRITGWMEDTAEMQSESMLELGDAIRDEMGQEQSQTFTDQIKPALDQLYQTLEQTRSTLTQGVAVLTGEAAPQQEMGAEPGMEEPGMEEPGMEPTVDQEMEDEFAASEPAVGGTEESGRMKREARRFARQKALSEHLELSMSLGQILSSKKK